MKVLLGAGWEQQLLCHSGTIVQGPKVGGVSAFDNAHCCNLIGAQKATEYIYDIPYTIIYIEGSYVCMVFGALSHCGHENQPRV